MTTTFPRTMASFRGSFGPFFDQPYDHATMRDQTMTSSPTFPPFKFESRRARIDWRLLHGIDINSMIRDVDLDTLEKIVNIVAFGDIEAEDTRHLTELNFIKIFRLSQMMIEYLLYVQECLQGSNAWLQQDRGNMDKYVQAARLRLRELEAALKMNKRELRRARKTIKTYELLAVLNDGKDGKEKVATVPVPAAATYVAPPAPPAQVIKVEASPVNAAMEALLRKELATLAERLSKATLECQTLRSERDELYLAVKDLETVVRTRPGSNEAPEPPRPSVETTLLIQGLQEQLQRYTLETTKLRSEKDIALDDLERANGEKRQLQEEKAKLLSELASRTSPEFGGQPTTSGAASDNMGNMLLDAEQAKAATQAQLDEARSEITALQKQLMKAMKETALGTMPPPAPSVSGPDERVLRDLDNANKQLANLQRDYNEDVQALQEELEMTQAKAVEADRKLAAMRASAAVTAERLGTRMSPPRGGLVKVVEERTNMDYEEALRNKDLLVEYEAVNQQLNQQLLQLKEERNVLADDVEGLRRQLQNRTSPAHGRDAGIERDWRTEEMERLKDGLGGARRRILDLEDALHDRDSLVERLRGTIRDLQAQLDDRSRHQDHPAAPVGRVKQQVHDFERRGGKHVKTTSFSFGPGEVSAGGGMAETPTSSPPKTLLDDILPSRPSPPRSSPEAAPTPELGVTAAPQLPEFSSPTPSRLPQPDGGAHDSKWLRRRPRPAPSEAYHIRQAVLSRVAGLQPEQLEMMIAEEVRVITENPYEFEDDDEAVFRDMLPYELAERPGVLSAQPHVNQDLEVARSLLTDKLLAVVDDEMSQFGIDVSSEALTDKDYAAAMQELAARRSNLLAALPREASERAERLRDALLTHLELVKRRAQQEQLATQQERLLKEQRTTGHAETDRPVVVGRAGRSGGLEIEPAGGAPMVGLLRSRDAPSGTQPEANAGAAVPSGQRDFARRESSTDELAAIFTVPPAEEERQQAPQNRASPAAPRLPAFPSRQSSLPRNPATRDQRTEDLKGLLPPPAGFRAPSEVAASAPSTSSMPQGATAPEASTAGSTRISPVPSPLERSLTGEASRGHQTSNANLNASTASRKNASITSHNSSIRAAQDMGPRSNSLPRATPEEPSSRGPVALQLVREEAPGPSGLVVGLARQQQQQQAPQQQPPKPQPVAASGNMNMSIRSVKYQESDFDDDDEDLMPLPQPKAVTRVVEGDEYALTEDEETQQDMGIEDSDPDFGPVGGQPKMLIRPGAGTNSPPRAAAAPSRLGPQRVTATSQSRGWATDVPLQAAPVPKSKRPSETADTAEMESIESFNNTLSQSLPRRPGAWGDGPAGPAQKMSTTQPRTLTKQPSGTSKPSGGWNESIRSIGGRSGAADEVQSVQELTGLDSFNDSIRPTRPTGRFMAPADNAGASQAFGGGSTGVRPAQPRRDSYSSELSDIEYA